MTDLPHLLRTREGYDDELSLFSFLIDAYTGGGGFEGSVKQPQAGFWGAAAERYAGSALRGNAASSYLDRYPREDDAKYKSRIDVSHYPNYIEPLTDLKLSYINKRPPTVQSRANAIQRWRDDMDGEGASFEDVARLTKLRAAVLGWAPLLIDLPRPSPAAKSRAHARALGLMRPRAVPLLPRHLTQWSVAENGEFRWCKVRMDYMDETSPYADPEPVTVITVWFPDRFDRFEIRDSEIVTEERDVPHPFGRVPIAVLRHKPDPGSHVVGLPMHAAAAMEAKALFNRMSELEEHLRSQVFPILVLAQDNASGEVVIGTDNGLVLPPEQKNVHYYLAPPASSAATLEQRIETSIREIYRLARIEYGRQSGGQVASGTARRFEFSQTNQALADYAGQIARWEKRVDQLLGAALGASTNQLTIQPQRDFGVEDLETDIRNAMDTISLSIGGTATNAIKLRLIEQLLPHMTPEMRAEVEAELEAEVEEAEHDKAMMAAIRDATANDDEGDTVGGEEAAA